VSSEPLESIYLITGSDTPKIAVALERLRARFTEGSIERLSAESTTGEDAVAASNALGLFSGDEKLVLVRDIERWKKADVEAIARYCESPTPGAVLALLGDASRVAGLDAACAAAGRVLRFDVPTRRVGRREVEDFPQWARTQLDRAGLRVDQGTAERLVEIAGEDALALQNEIDKLVAWAGGVAVGPSDVELLAAPTSETSGFAVANAWGARDAGGALRACEAELLREPEPFRIAARLAGHVARVRTVQALLDEGLSVSDLPSRLGLKYPPRREAAEAGRYSPTELEDAVVRLALLDHALKGGSRLASELELERALVDITKPDR
jgi:DNA polymerase III delta subunit